jgi:segregation and condensation protein B
VLSPRQIDEWLNRAATVTPPADAEMGLPLEEGEGESPSLEPVEIESVDDVSVEPEASIEGDAPDADPEQKAAPAA